MTTIRFTHLPSFPKTLILGPDVAPARRRSPIPPRSSAVPPPRSARSAGSAARPWSPQRRSCRCGPAATPWPAVKGRHLAVRHGHHIALPGPGRTRTAFMVIWEYRGKLMATSTSPGPMRQQLLEDLAGGGILHQGDVLRKSGGDKSSDTPPEMRTTAPPADRCGWRSAGLSTTRSKAARSTLLNGGAEAVHIPLHDAGPSTSCSCI